MKVTIKDPNTNKVHELQGFEKYECIQSDVNDKIKELKNEVANKVINGYPLFLSIYSKYVSVCDLSKRLNEEFLGSACVLSMDEMDDLIKKVKEIV